MAKRFKLRLSLPSFQFCRLKQSSSLPYAPLPAATYFFSPLNPKAFDIAYPTVPEPPPTTPNHPMSNLKPLPRIKSEFSRQNSFDSDVKTPPEEPDGDTWPAGVGKIGKKKQQRKNNRKKKGKSSICLSISSADSGWFSSSSEFGEERESLISSSTSFDSSYDFGNSSVREPPIRRKKKRRNNSRPESVAPARKSVFRRLMPCAADRMLVEESFAMVKNSVDPREDFKKSMMEMILEKQMFEVEDLERLLQCFLSLNSPDHHQIIVEAFTEIWEVLFL